MKKISKKILDDSDDEEDGSANGNKEEIKSELGCVNGGSTETVDKETGSMETDSTNSGSMETGDKETGSTETGDKEVKEGNDAVKKDSPKLSCSASSDDDIPKRKTGVYNVTYVV